MRTVVDEGGDDLRFGPLGFRIVLFGESVPTAVVGDGYLRKIVFQNGLVEVNDELEEKNQNGDVRCYPGNTHSLDRIWYLRKCGLLCHLVLHGDEGGFIDPWLGCIAGETGSGLQDKNN
jgi:hypothetical protein